MSDWNDAVKRLEKEFEKRQIEFYYCENKREANEKICELIAPNSSVGWCGSETLRELETIEEINRLAQEKKLIVFDRDAVVDRAERNRVSREAAGADYFLGSANAVVTDGRLLTASAYGNRICGFAYAKKKTIVVVGKNKLVDSLEAAFDRLRNHAVPLNCKRLNWSGTPCFATGRCDDGACRAPEYFRMCGQILITEFECVKGRMAVVLVNENLGF